MTDWFKHEAQNSSFDFETVCMCSMFSRLARRDRLSISNGAGITVELGPGKRNNYVYGPTPFYTVESTLDARGFFSLDDHGKKVFAVHVMEEGVKAVSSFTEEDYEKFNVIFSEIKNLNYINRFLWKEIRSKSNNLHAQVFVRQEVGCIDVELEFVSGMSRVRGSKLISRIEPNEYLLHEMLGTVKLGESGDLFLVSRGGACVARVTMID